MQAFLQSKEFMAIEHMVKVAAYIAASGFLATLITEMAHNKALADLIAQNPLAAVVFMLVNVLLAGALNYVNQHKADVGA